MELHNALVSMLFHVGEALIRTLLIRTLLMRTLLMRTLFMSRLRPFKQVETCTDADADAHAPRDHINKP